MAEPNTNRCDNLRVIYNETVAEIARYRDYEWKHAIYFTTAVATIIGLRLAETIETPCYDLYLEILVVALTVAHIYFSCYAHKGLAINRSKQAYLKVEMKVVSLDEEIGLQPSKKIWDNFNAGLRDHLSIFFLVNLLITAFGFSVLKVSGPSYWLIIVSALIFLVAGIWYLCRELQELDKKQKCPLQKVSGCGFWIIITLALIFLVAIGIWYPCSVALSSRIAALDRSAH